MLPVKTSLLPTVSRFFADDWNNVFDWSNRDFTSNLSSLPSVNIQELPDSIIVEVAAPGMKKEDFKIELHNGVLSIESEVQNVENKKDAAYTRREFNYRSFRRSFDLNDKIIDQDNINAKYKDCVLKLHLAKKEEAKVKPARVIQIS